MDMNLCSGQDQVKFSVVGASVFEVSTAQIVYQFIYIMSVLSTHIQTMVQDYKELSLLINKRNATE